MWKDLVTESAASLAPCEASPSSCGGSAPSYGAAGTRCGADSENQIESNRRARSTTAQIVGSCEAPKRPPRAHDDLHHDASGQALGAGLRRKVASPGGRAQDRDVTGGELVGGAEGLGGEGCSDGQIGIRLGQERSGPNRRTDTQDCRPRTWAFVAGRVP